jgi:hypothetical protein
MSDAHSPEHEHQAVRQEEDRINSGRIVVIGLITLAVFAVGIAWAVSVQRELNGTIRNEKGAAPSSIGHTEIGMVYQPLFEREKGIAAERSAAQQQRLDSVGWTGGDKKFVHIPIERAMQLVTERNKL